MSATTSGAEGWGKGFVLALSRRWSEPEAAYRAWHRGRASNDFAPGAVQLVPVERYVQVANMIGRRGVIPRALGSSPTLGFARAGAPPWGARASPSATRRSTARSP